MPSRRKAKRNAEKQARKDARMRGDKSGSKSKYGRKARGREIQRGFSTRPGSPFFVPAEAAKGGGRFVDPRPLPPIWSWHRISKSPPMAVLREAAA